MEYQFENCCSSNGQYSVPSRNCNENHKITNCRTQSKHTPRSLDHFNIHYRFQCSARNSMTKEQQNLSRNCKSQQRHHYQPPPKKTEDSYHEYIAEQLKSSGIRDCKQRSLCQVPHHDFKRTFTNNEQLRITVYQRVPGDEVLDVHNLSDRDCIYNRNNKNTIENPMMKEKNVKHKLKYLPRFYYNNENLKFFPNSKVEKNLNKTKIDVPENKTNRIQRSTETAILKVISNEKLLRTSPNDILNVKCSDFKHTTSHALENTAVDKNNSLQQRLLEVKNKTGKDYSQQLLSSSCTRSLPKKDYASEKVIGGCASAVATSNNMNKSYQPLKLSEVLATHMVENLEKTFSKGSDILCPNNLIGNQYLACGVDDIVEKFQDLHISPSVFNKDYLRKSMLHHKDNSLSTKNCQKFEEMKNKESARNIFLRKDPKNFTVNSFFKKSAKDDILQSDRPPEKFCQQGVIQSNGYNPKEESNCLKDIIVSGNNERFSEFTKVFEHRKCYNKKFFTYLQSSKNNTAIEDMGNKKAIPFTKRGSINLYKNHTLRTISSCLQERLHHNLLKNSKTNSDICSNSIKPLWASVDKKYDNSEIKQETDRNISIHKTDYDDLQISHCENSRLYLSNSQKYQLKCPKTQEIKTADESCPAQQRLLLCTTQN